MCIYLNIHLLLYHKRRLAIFLFLKGSEIMLISKKEMMLKVIHNNIDNFRCPFCHRSIKVIDNGSLLCSKNHTFDISKQGYIYMLNHPARNFYNKDLFYSRHKIITETGLYDSMHKIISENIIVNLDDEMKSTILLDAGCGEGSHLQRIMEISNNESIVGVGLDISRDGIRKAAKHYAVPIWLVGDLANTPMADRSCHAILNILSPANYKEFYRMLTGDGIIIKVIPGDHYLKELRETVFENRNGQPYENKETVSLFKQNFNLFKKYKINEKKCLNQAELINIAQMTPLVTKANKEKVKAFVRQKKAEITIDLDILIGKKK